MPSLLNPYTNMTGGEWLRGNLHTHSTRSDGDRPPQQVLDDYASRGYGFLMFSDHSVTATETELAALNNRGLVLLPGVELGGGPHILHVDGVRGLTHGIGRQAAINEILAQEKETGRGFAIVCHPNWEKDFEHCTIAQLREWIGYLGVEIYNGSINRVSGSPYALEKWDSLLSEGRQIWGFANDDSHLAKTDIALGWNMAYVRERTCAGVVDALRSGRFYASTGVTIKSIQVDGMRIRVETENACRIAAIRDTGARFAVCDGPVLEAEVPHNAVYARIQAWGSGEKMAWSQPLMVQKDADVFTATKFISSWRISTLALHEKLSDASLEKAARLNYIAQQSSREKHKELHGFVDARPQIQGRPGVVYCMAEFEAPVAGRGTLYLGYDGPVRVWLNEREVFYGPGNNPALPDRLAMHADFCSGVNRLALALETNNGNAWGIFGRVDLPQA